MITIPLYFIKQVVQGREYFLRCQLCRFFFRDDVNIDATTKILSMNPKILARSSFDTVPCYRLPDPLGCRYAKAWCRMIVGNKIGNKLPVLHLSSKS